jgi:Domain of unknown function (DUF3598)
MSVARKMGEFPSQWDCMLQNLGSWEGSFARFRIDGTLISEISSQLLLEQLADRSARLTLKRDSPDYPKPLVQEYSSLHPSILFAETGAFSQGALQTSSSQFGAEFGHVCGDRRLRLVQLFTPDRKPEFVTLIREKRSGTAAGFAEVLTVADLLGTWQGEAVTVYPDLRQPDRFTSTLAITQTDEQADEQADEQTIQQSLTFGDRTITSSGRIDGQSLFFEQGPVTTQVLRLPDRASVSFPVEVPTGMPFFLECGWMPEPAVRHRLIRSYDANGHWVSFTQVIERRV